MNRIEKVLMLLVFLMAQVIFVSCSKDDDDPKTVNNEQVTISDDGKVSNGGIFSSLDDQNFYLDYIKYTVKEGHLVVSGYDRVGFKGVAKIVARITYKGNSYEVLGIGTGAFYNCGKLTSVNIPNSVIYIGEDAFKGCSDLVSITIPHGVTSIGGYVFYECSGLKSVHCLSSTPPTVGWGWDCLFSDDTYHNATLYVPKGSLAAYRSVEEWKYFENIVEE